MLSRTRSQCCVLAGLGLLIAGVADGASADGTVDFVKDVQPIFAKHCYACHGPERQKHELRLDVKSVALAGGESGKAIVPGDADGSRLIRSVSGADPKVVMPPEGQRLN